MKFLNNLFKKQKKAINSVNRYFSKKKTEHELIIAGKAERKFWKELNEKMPVHKKTITPFEENSKIMNEIANKSIKEGWEFASLTEAEKFNKLKAINASSEWSAFYDLRAFPPKEDYTENEEFFENVPYFKDCIDLRAELSVGVGLEIKDDKSNEQTSQEDYLNSEYKRHKIITKMVKAQKHADIYGNGYLYLDWLRNNKGKKIGLKRVLVLQPTRVRIRLTDDKEATIIGYAWIPPQLIIGSMPQPIPILKDEIIHFKGDDYDDSPYGYSKVFGIKKVLQSRWDINILLPILFKHYAKPWMHFSIKSEGLNETKLASYIDALSDLLEQTGPDSDLITSDRVSGNVFSGSQAMKHPMELIEDLDNQLFGQMKVPETYFKAKGSTDRMILKQDDNFVKEMRRIQEQRKNEMTEGLNKPLLEANFGEHITYITDLSTGKTIKQENYVIPEISWNEIFEEDKNQLYQRIGLIVDRGLVAPNEARKMLNLEAMSEEELQEIQMNKMGGGIPMSPENINDNTGAENIGLTQEHDFPEDSAIEDIDAGEFNVKFVNKNIPAGIDAGDFKLLLKRK